MFGYISDYKGEQVSFLLLDARIREKVLETQDIYSSSGFETSPRVLRTMALLPHCQPLQLDANSDEAQGLVLSGWVCVTNGERPDFLAASIGASVIRPILACQRDPALLKPTFWTAPGNQAAGLGCVGSHLGSWYPHGRTTEETVADQDHKHHISRTA